MSAAIKAIAAGRRGAASIHKVLYDLDLELPQNVLTPNFPVQDVDHLDHVVATPRQIMPIAKSNGNPDQELETGFDEAMARAEADRCLQCGPDLLQADRVGNTAGVSVSFFGWDRGNGKRHCGKR